MRNLRPMAKTTVLSITSCIIILLILVLKIEASRQNGICPWLTYKNTTCLRSNFLCSNLKCIERTLYCNGVNDCGDKSDEDGCTNYNYCNRYVNRRQCGNRCLPKEWFCDGIKDCSTDEEEQSCKTSNFEHISKEYLAMTKGFQWLKGQKKTESTTEIWGSSVDKSAVAHYFSDTSFLSHTSGTRKEIAYEVSIQLLSRLYGKKLQDIPSEDLASFVNAFLVSCLNPRKFHGIDIVRELRTRADNQNYTNPYVFLTLCNAGETITESDKLKLIETFWSKRRTFWTDMQAVVVMALACANKQSNNDIDLETISELTMELKAHQYRNGSVENVQTTALVMQALYSAEPDDDPNYFDEGKALEQIIQSQKPDGSFGNLMNTYFVLPVLNCKSLIDVNSDHCQAVSTDETSALENLANRSGPKIRVQYSIWIGNEKDLERHLALRVPASMSLYGIMEIAAEIDSRYRFEYVVKNRKPYVNSLSGLQDNPEKGKFWFLYALKDGQPSPSQESPADVKPKDNDHFVMWYRRGTWID